MYSNYEKWFLLKTGTDISRFPTEEQKRQEEIFKALNMENEETGFVAWFNAFTGKTFDKLWGHAYRYSATQRDVNAFVSMKDMYKERYREEREQMRFYLELPESEFEFNNWLKLRTGKTVGQLYTIARATGNYASYEKMINWYKNRYQLEHENPFLEAVKTAGEGDKL